MMWLMSLEASGSQMAGSLSYLGPPVSEESCDYKFTNITGRLYICNRLKVKYKYIYTAVYLAINLTTLWIKMTTLSDCTIWRWMILMSYGHKIPITAPTLPFVGFCGMQRRE